MSHPSTLPPAERDLPVGRTEFLRMQVMAQAEDPPRRAKHRLAPIAASVAVLAIAGGTALVVQGQAHDHTGLGAGPRVYVDDPTIARGCGLPGGRVLVDFSDEFGAFAVVAKQRDIANCYVFPDGSVTQGGGSSGTPVPGPATKRQAVQLQEWGGGPGAWTGPGPTPSNGELCGPGNAARTHVLVPSSPDTYPPPSCLPQSVTRKFRTEHDAWGTVAAGIDRVVVTWSGRPPVEATIRDHYFAVRYLDPTGLMPYPATVTVRAYDATGHLVRRVTEEA